MARKRRTRRRRRTGGLGRLFEGMVVLILLLVVLTFGISIASRFLPEEAANLPVQQQDVRGPAIEAPTPAARLIRNAQVEVRNGCGRNGLAQSIGLVLRDGGFDVLEWADLKPYDHQVTRILAEERFRETGASLAAYLQRRYGVGLLDVGDVPGGAADIQVILGWDLADALDRAGAADPEGVVVGQAAEDGNPSGGVQTGR